MLRAAVCVSGGGTNLQALIDAIEQGNVTNTQIVGVLSNNAGARALERAREHGIPSAAVCPRDYQSREAFEKAMLEKLCQMAPDLIVLAGFLVKIPEEMVCRFPNRIINIHPSLIPSF